MKVFQKSKYLLVLILAASVLLRLLTAIYLGNEVVILPGTTDQLSYHHLALRLLDGHGFTFGEPWWPLTAPNAPTAHWSYLYTFFVTSIYGTFGKDPLVVRVIQVFIIGILQPYLAYLIGRRLFSDWAGLAAAALTAVYIYFVYYAATLMTEPFYITAILASLYLTIRMADSDDKHLTKQALVLGLLLGMIVLLRQLYLLIIPFQMLWLVWARYKRHGRLALGEMILAGTLIVAMVLPFTYYNYVRFDRFVLLNTNAGYAFFLGNHPIYGTRFVPILTDYTLLIPDDLPVRQFDEAALDTELLGRGIQFVVDDPGRYVLLSLSRIPVYFTFWPTAESGMLSNAARIGSFGLMFPFMLYGLYVGLRQYGSRQILESPLALLLGFALIYTVIHVLTWTLIRYRLPVDAVLLVFAGAGLVDLAQRLAPNLLPSAEISPSR